MEAASVTTTTDMSIFKNLPHDLIRDIILMTDSAPKIHKRMMAPVLDVISERGEVYWYNRMLDREDTGAPDCFPREGDYDDEVYDPEIWGDWRKDFSDFVLVWFMGFGDEQSFLAKPYKSTHPLRDSRWHME